MVFIEKPPWLQSQSTDAVVALHFQTLSHTVNNSTTEDLEFPLERIAVAGGTCVKLWALRWPSSKSDDDKKSAQQKSENLAAAATEPVPAVNDSSNTSHLQLLSDGGCQIRSRLLCVIKEHAPHYLVGLRFSPTGHLLASCDSRTIVVSEFVRFVNPSSTGIGSGRFADRPLDEIWKTASKMNDHHSDIFDLCWHGNDKVLTGAVDGLKVWNVRGQSLYAYVKYSNGFVTGIATHGIQLIGAQSNDKRVVVWKKQKPLPSQRSESELHHYAPQNPRSCFSGYTQIIDDTDTFSFGLADLPYYRRGSFDFTGEWVAFPYGERGNQCFGVVYSIASPTSPVFRFRGHQLRVNCVSFSTGVWEAVACGDVSGEQSSTSELLNASAPTSSGAVAKTVVFTLYAQASVDGALSIWKFFYPTKNGPTRAECILLLKPRFLDEQASVTDLSWNDDGTTLAVGGDDGTVTIIRISPKDIHGSPRRHAAALSYAHGYSHTTYTCSAERQVCAPRWHPLVEDADCERFTGDNPASSATKATLPCKAFTGSGTTEGQKLLPINTKAAAPPEAEQPETVINGGKKARRRVVPTLVSSVPSTSSEFL